jgi:OmpA-OmpF porin, OOP family
VPFYGYALNLTRIRLSVALRQKIDKKMNTFLLRQFVIVLAVFAAAGCATSAISTSERSSEQLPSAGREQSRITDGVIRADLKYFASLQARLAALNTKGIPASNYYLSKATAWLEFAQEEYTDNDRSGIVERILSQALVLIQKMEQGELSAEKTTTLIEGSKRIREDLWAKLATFQQHARFDCVQGKVAQAEVQLVWAGHEELEGGWRHSKPYIEIAEDQVSVIDKALTACDKAIVIADATKPTPEPQAKLIEPSPAKAADVEPIVLSTDTLFKFNKSSLDDVLPSAKQVLENFAQSLRQHRSIEKILITGHTDRLGSPAYNLRLSEARAAAIAQYLIEKGFSKDVIQSAGAGESDPLTTCSGNQGTPELQACLQPNRRVEVRVKATR